MNKKGQSVFSEYVMIFFVVVAVAVAMTTFVQRGFEARIHDARNYMIGVVNNRSVADSNFLMAAGGGRIPHEYEPYYEQFSATVENNQGEAHGTMPGNPQALGAIYLKSVNGEAVSSSISVQLPAMCSIDNPPPCCNDGTGCTRCSCPTGHVCGVDTCGNPTGCGTCGAGYGCNAAGQCYRCVCPTYNGYGTTYTGICGADTCGNPTGCNTYLSSPTTAACMTGANGCQSGACLMLNSNQYTCCYLGLDQCNPATNCVDSFPTDTCVCTYSVYM